MARIPVPRSRIRHCLSTSGPSTASSRLRPCASSSTHRLGAVTPAMRTRQGRARCHALSGSREWSRGPACNPGFPIAPGSRAYPNSDSVRPAKAGAFSGSQSHRGKSRSPVAWVAGLQLGNRDSEAYRQSHRKDGGESPGRSTSEREVASKICSPGSRACRILAKAAGPIANRPMRWVAPAGWLSTAWWQGRAKQLEKPSSSR
jgi:hypothetical protein